MDSVWAGLVEVLEQIRKSPVPIDDLAFDTLVDKYCARPLVYDDEDWSMSTVARHLYKVMWDATELKARNKMKDAKKRNGIEAYRLLARHHDSRAYDTNHQLMEGIMVVARA